MKNILETFCPSCKSVITADAFFCPNCGKQLKDKPLAITLWKQAVVYAVSIFIPPFGLIYAWKYLKQHDTKSKIIGFVAIILTVISLAFTFWTMDVLVSSIDQSINQINTLGL